MMSTGTGDSQADRDLPGCKPFLFQFGSIFFIFSKIKKPDTGAKCASFEAGPPNIYPKVRADIEFLMSVKVMHFKIFF